MGSVTNYPASDPTGGWELEESLDVEWAHAMAPGASITLVEANSDDTNDLLAAVKYAAAHANVVSMSWGGGEFSGETADDSYFDQAGVAFVASSGDSGAPASWPAASPNALSVGGTALTVGTGNVWSNEAGWSGSGGGPSAYEAQPSYQKGVVTQTGSARATPDVAYDASPSTGVAVYDSVPYNGQTLGWIEVGGTSAGAPQWSALLAIADQGRALSGQEPLDSTSPQEVMSILYAKPTDFHYITSGSSTGNPNYSAGPGYNYVTGVGSPIANLVVGSLVGATTAEFVKEDTTTEGNWIGTYGSQGYDVIDDASSLPGYATVTPSGESNYVWAPSTTDPRALQTAGGSSRIAATWWTTTSFTVDVNLTDGQTHDLELYFLDCDKQGRTEQVKISNATTGEVLSTQTVSSFQSRVYLDYAVSGNILITITKGAGTSNVLSGLFVDPTTTTTN
jgi:subtilase family serine protease